MDFETTQHKSALVNHDGESNQSHTSYGAFLNSEEIPAEFTQKTIFGEVGTIILQRAEFLSQLMFRVERVSYYLFSLVVNHTICSLVVKVGPYIVGSMFLHM